MGEPSLSELEHEVEIARSKLARDLSTLSSPETYSQFTDTLKHEAMSVKDTLVDKAKSSVQSTFDSFVEELKARAAANPTAALAIGAGVAWRLVQRPPIATALVGAGLISLLRTNPTGTKGRTTNEYVAEAAGRLHEQASGLASDMKEQAGRAYEVASGQVANMADAAKDRAGQAVHAAVDQVTEVAGVAKERVQEWANHATAAVEGAATQLKEQTVSVARQAKNQAAEVAQSVVRATDTVVDLKIGAHVNGIQRAVQDQESRDSILLGVAGFAVIAALGIACQRKFGET